MVVTVAVIAHGAALSYRGGVLGGDDAALPAAEKRSSTEFIALRTSPPQAEEMRSAAPSWSVSGASRRAFIISTAR